MIQKHLHKQTQQPGVLSMCRYEVVRADNWQQAKDRAQLKAGDLCIVDHVEAVANSDGTFSVFPICRPLTQQERWNLTPGQKE